MKGDFLVFGIPTVLMASFFECLGGLISIFGISIFVLLVVALFFGRLGGLISKAVGLGIEVVEDDFVDVLEFFFVEIFIFTKDFRLVLLAGESTLRFAVASSSSR